METIKNNREFRAIYQNGVSLADRNLVLHYMPRKQEAGRFGITVSSKVGNAVIRNKLKRQIREILRVNRDTISPSYDIIFVVRVRCREADFAQIKKSVRYLLKKSGLLTDDAPEFH